MPRPTWNVFILVLTVGLTTWSTQTVASGPSSTGPVLLLTAGQVDPRAQTVTLPLSTGRMKDGRRVWYVITDTSDRQEAAQRRVNHASKLANAPAGGTRVATQEADGTLTFESGTVNFAPSRIVTAGAPSHPSPPSAAEPGSIGDTDYTPLLRIRNRGAAVFNAPIVAFGVEAGQIAFCEGKPDHRLVHDRVVEMCPARGTVTLSLTPGFSAGRQVLYIGTEGSDRGVAAMEAATFAPRLASASPAGGYGEHRQVEPIVVVINGATGQTKPRRQGLDSALLDGKPFGPVGTIVNCPIVERLE